MPYERAHAPIYGYMKGFRHTIPLHLAHYARTFSIFKVLNRLSLGRVLNVGGADGYHSHLMEKLLRADVTTLDLDEHALSVARRRYGLKTCCGSALDIPFADGSFDTVVCIETIEHIEGSQRVVDELLRVARHNLLISTESFFGNERQKSSFLLYIRQTHPQFFRAKDPVQRGDVSYFTLADFQRLLGGRPFSTTAQFASKHMEVLGDIAAIRRHVRAMTENLAPNKKTKLILLCPLAPSAPNPAPLSEEELLAGIVQEGPLFPIELDDDMRREDEENRERIERWHAEKAFAVVRPAGSAPALAIEEEGASGMTLRWLTAENLERSPMFCTRRVELAPGGHTPLRAAPWEHQLHILSGRARLVETGRTTDLAPGDTAHIEPGLAFQVRNEGSETLAYLDMVPSISTLYGR